MLDKAFTRRRFLAGTAGVAAIAGFSGLAGCSAPTKSTSGETTIVHALCAGCAHQCGYSAYVVDGAVTKTIGDNHPAAMGRLCSDGYGIVDAVTSPELRVKTPLKRNASGSFQEVSWDDALAEISTAIANIVEHDGASSLACIYDSRPSAAFYAPRFMKALGSANAYDLDAAHTLPRVSGFTQVVGGDAVSDFEHARAVLLLGNWALETLSPAEIAALQTAKEAGAEIILASTRMSDAATLATRWIPLNPSTELALVLGIECALERNGLIDKAFVSEHVSGFNDWNTTILQYTPEWAESKCGVPANVVEELASILAAAAPASSISMGGINAPADVFAQAGELARAIAIGNSLLGCWNQEGGACLYPHIEAKTLTSQFAEPAVKDEPYGSDEYPLAAAPAASVALRGAKSGALKGVIFCGADVVGSCPDADFATQALDALELSVVITPYLTATATHAQYVLPALTFLEQTELPAFISGLAPAVALNNSAIESTFDEALSTDQIFKKLAEACGVGEYFDFTIDELANAQLKSLGLTVDALKRVGTSYLPDQAMQFGILPKWDTPTGKVQFTSTACEKAGLSAIPEWSEETESSSKDTLVVVTGAQMPLRRVESRLAKALSSISEEYGLERVWISTADAEALGISDGDVIEVSNNLAKEMLRVKVSPRIAPGAVYLTDGFGITIEKDAQTVGKSNKLAASLFAIESGYGNASNVRGTVTLWKAGD